MIKIQGPVGGWTREYGGAAGGNPFLAAMFKGGHFTDVFDMALRNAVMDQAKTSGIVGGIGGGVLSGIFGSLGGKGGGAIGKGGIPVGFELPAAVRDLAGDLRREYAKESEGGIGVAGGQLDEFWRKYGLIRQARYGLMGDNTAMMGMTGVAATMGVPGIIDEKLADFAILRQYENLRRFAKVDGDQSVSAVKRGTSEAQDAINRHQAQQTSLQEEIRNTFLRAEALQKEQRDYQAALVAALKEYLATHRPVSAGGFWGMPFGGGN
jgi:hypothetical protein